MMARWGLDGMRSFEQVSVAKKEGNRIEQRVVDQSAAPSSSRGS
jgi:biotin synthase